MKWVAFIPSSQRRLVMRAAQQDEEPVWISGPSGSGKSGIARWIHSNSPRSTKPLVTLSHHEPLTQQILKAQGGALLISDWENWSATEHSLFTRVIRTKSIDVESGAGAFRRMLHVRVIVTSTSPLVEPSPLKKDFPQFAIEMPALSTRTEEFEDIVQSLLHEMAHELKKDHLRGLDRPAWSVLRSHSWPGNLRELRNVLKIAVLRAQGDKIESTDLPMLGAKDAGDYFASREEFEKATIRELLKTFGGELTQASAVLRIDVETLKKKITQYGLQA